MEKREGEKLLSVVVAACAATALCALYGFSGMFMRAYQIFAFAEEEDMSFGWFVPLFSIYVLWTNRAKLVPTIRRGGFSFAGLLASLPFLGLALLGTRGVQLRLEQLGFIGLCVTVPWTFFGWRCARQFLFPAAYLLFCIPLATFLDIVTIHLRYLASGTALAVLNGFGFEAVREGTAVISRGAHAFAVDVAEPCSGLRSLFALMALTAGYAYFNQPTWLRRGILFACSVPLAVAGNVARIVSICVIASGSDPKFATGFYHDYSGYIVFIVAIALMVLMGEVIDRLFRTPVKPAAAVAEPDVAPVPVSALWKGKILPVLAMLFFVSVFIFQATTPAATIAKAPSGAHFLVSFVIGGTSRASIHRPELCLPSQGYVMSNPRNFEAGGRPWHALDMVKPGGLPGMEAYTFFNQAGFRTASHTRRIWRDVIDRSVLNRVDRWVMLTVHVTGATEPELKAFLERIGGFE